MKIMKIKQTSLFATIFLLGACASSPKHASPSEMNNFPTFQAFLKSKIKLPAHYYYSPYTYGELLQPFSYAVDYCENQGGNLIQVTQYPELPVPQVRLHNEVQMRQEAIVKIHSAFGAFSCVNNGSSVWRVEIHHSGAVETIDSNYATSVSIQ